ncbi:MAG: aldo/keto reductase family protein, partial [Planctomycetota bacterium]|nr:aldo/keto reductase family protein [Planctomycetota bacterium]
MKYRRLGMWGVKLSEIGLGSWLVFRDGDQDKATELHRVAYENGINFYDTANAYGGGQTERLVGEALAPFPRESFVLATKLYWPVRDAPFPGANDRGLSRKQVFERCHISLERLGTDYVDLYQCHRYDEETPLVETCRAMNDLIDQGKVLYWGVSEWTAEQIAEAVSICDDNGWHRPVSNQPLYNMLERDAEAEVLPTCARLGLGVVNFSPLAEGVLTGKYLDETPSGSRAADEFSGQILRRRLTDENAAKVRRLKELGDGMGAPTARLAIAWCLRRLEITSAIIGASRPA